MKSSLSSSLLWKTTQFLHSKVQYNSITRPKYTRKRASSLPLFLPFSTIENVWLS